MARVANGELPLVVEVHRAVELKKLLEGTEKFDRLRLVLAGGTEAMAADCTSAVGCSAAPSIRIACRS